MDVHLDWIEFCHLGIADKSPAAMPSAAENMATVQAMYSSFGQGNLDGVLEHLADDIEWMKKPDKPNLGQVSDCHLAYTMYPHPLPLPLPLL